jgi:hypothetical protein
MEVDLMQAKATGEPNRDCFGATWKFQRRRPIDSDQAVLPLDGIQGDGRTTGEATN